KYTYDKLHPSLMYRGADFDVGLAYKTPVKLISEMTVTENGKEVTKNANANTEPAEITLFGQTTVKGRHGLQIHFTQVLNEGVEVLEGDQKSTLKDII